MELPIGEIIKEKALRQIIDEHAEMATDAQKQHWAADCLSRVIPLYEKEYPADETIREAISDRRRYANGLISPEDFAAALKPAEIMETKVGYQVPRLIASASSQINPFKAAEGACGAVSHSAGRYLASADDWSRRPASDRDKNFNLTYARSGLQEMEWQVKRLIYWIEHPSPHELELPKNPAAQS